ncbi:RNA polymerase II mediator complex subunit [Arachnomyces sp. PD_36]|nr:RNA polymerase II mediator complex subunit [Arachnomyces sp. PD_36]
MADSFPLPLRPTAKPDSTKNSLPIRIAQINNQRGSFRNVTEQSLLEEIEAAKARGSLEEEENLDFTDKDDAPDRQEQLMKSRTEIMEFAAQAHAETTYALDFISLLLSKHTPRQAEISMSPYLKQNAPLGSLGMDVIKTPEQSESAKKDIDVVSRGWKLESFNSAASKLLKSATRLEKEVAAETKYWGEVLAVKEKGWNVCRLPRERQTLGVQFGFIEATAIYRERGLAALRRGEEGKLILDKGTMSSKPKAVRLRVQQDGKTVGSSRVPTLGQVDDESIEGRILHSRNTLYEEELFHELNREARVLASHGVVTRQNLIQFTANDKQQILIDLVDLDDNEASDENPLSDEHNTLAQATAHSLRILLSHAHRQNLRRRTQTPPPLAARKRPTPEYQLLGPCLAYLQHDFHVRSLDIFLRDLYSTVHSSGLKCDYTTSRFESSSLTGDNPTTNSFTPPMIESLVHTFLSPFESTIKGNLISSASSFTIKIRTAISPSSSGTEYDFTISLPGYPDVSSPPKLGLRDEVEHLIMHLFTLDIVSTIPSLSNKNPPDTIKPAEAGLPRPPPPYLNWEAIYPHHGELLAYSKVVKRNKKLTVNVDRDQLSLTVSWLGGPEPDGDEFDTILANRKDGPYIWRREGAMDSGDVEVTTRTLEAVVKEAGKEEEKGVIKT